MYASASDPIHIAAEAYMEGVVTVVEQLAFTDAYSIAIIHPSDFTLNIIANLIFLSNPLD
jgi:hypothetical protein